MPALLLDLDGTIYQRDVLIAGAGDAVRWFATKGIPHLFLTNTTSRSRRALAEKLEGFGIPATADRILTPAFAARRWLADNAKGPVAPFMPKAAYSELEGLELLDDEAEEGAAAVVIGDLGDEWDAKQLNRAFRLLMATPRPALVALGMTRYWLAPDGLRLDVAAYVAALQHATGAEPVVLGKPAVPFYETALSILGVDASETVMVGDDIVSDVDGAQRAGMRGVLVRTGKFTPGDLSCDVEPDAVLDSIADLPGWWESATG